MLEPASGSCSGGSFHGGVLRLASQSDGIVYTGCGGESTGSGLSADIRIFFPSRRNIYHNGSVFALHWESNIAFGGKFFLGTSEYRFELSLYLRTWWLFGYGCAGSGSCQRDRTDGGFWPDSRMFLFFLQRHDPPARSFDACGNLAAVSEYSLTDSDL